MKKVIRFLEKVFINNYKGIVPKPDYEFIKYNEQPGKGWFSFKLDFSNKARVRTKEK